MPDPDLTTVTLADAHLIGGPEFVAEVREDATAVADELAPIGPQGEPVHRESAWTPARCPAGHPHQPGRGCREVRCMVNPA